MKTTLWILAWSAGLLFAVILAAWVGGSLLPAEHVSESERTLPVPPGRVAELIRDVAAQPRWRTGVKQVDILQREPRRWRYREHGRNGTIAFLVTESESGTRFESHIDDPSLPFGGRWIFALEPDGKGTRLRIREEGIVRPAVFRFLSRFVFGHGTNIRLYLDDLARVTTGG